jgi:hypothetical protein
VAFALFMVNKCFVAGWVEPFVKLKKDFVGG